MNDGRHHLVEGRRAAERMILPSFPTGHGGFGKSGRLPSGPDQVHAHVLRAPFQSGRLDQSQHAGLGGRVGRLTGHTLISRVGADDNDRTSALGLKTGSHRAQTVKETREIGRNDVRPVIFSVPENKVCASDSGGADEAQGTRAVACEKSNHLLHRRRIAHVGLMEHCLAAGSLQFAQEQFRGRFASVIVNPDTASRLCKCAADRPTDAARRPDDQH